MDTFLFLSSYCYPCGRNENNNDFPGVSDGKVYAYNVGDPGSNENKEAGVVPTEYRGNKNRLFIPFALDILHF